MPVESDRLPRLAALAEETFGDADKRATGLGGETARSAAVRPLAWPTRPKARARPKPFLDESITALPRDPSSPDRGAASADA